MSGKVMVVTGGNRGIGQEICRQLGAQGHTVYLGARTLEKGEAIARQLSDTVEAIALDVNSDDSVQAAADRIRLAHGRVDVVINNAGIGVGSAGIASPDLEEIRSIMETNFYGPLRMVRSFLPLLKNSADGRLINISSGMGAIGEPGTGYAGYRLSKAGLNAQTLFLAQEVGDSIRVNAICPGWVRTDMGGAGAQRPVEKGAETAVWLATAENTPHGKFLRDKQVIPW